MDRPTALDLPQVEPLPEATQAYFDKCVEKLGMVPNVLRAYAFDIAKLDAFAGMYNELMLGPSGLTQARARDDRGGGLGGEPLLLLPDRAWRGGARAVGRPGARRDAGDELPRGAADAAAAGDARFRGEDDAGERRDRRGGPRGAARARASPSATSGTSRRWRPSSTCRTAWRAPSTCGRTRTTTPRRADLAAGLAALVLAYVLSQFFRAFLAVLAPVARRRPRRDAPRISRSPRGCGSPPSPRCRSRSGSGSTGSGRAGPRACCSRSARRGRRAVRDGGLAGGAGRGDGADRRWLRAGADRVALHLRTDLAAGDVRDARGGD